MSVSLAGAISRNAIDEKLAAEAARKGANLSTAVRAFRSTNPVARQLGTDYALLVPTVSETARAAAKKADLGALHHRAKATAWLPDNALRLYDLVLKADDAAGHAHLIEIDAYEAANALGITPDAAREARDGLVRVGLVKFFSNGSGDSGYRPTP